MLEHHEFRKDFLGNQKLKALLLACFGQVEHFHQIGKKCLIYLSFSV